MQDNYEAREIAKAKGTLHEGVSYISALFTGETRAKDTPFLAYDRKWLKENAKTRVTWFSMSALTFSILYGVISKMTNMLLQKAAGEKVAYKRINTTATFAGMMLVGGAFSYAASLAEAKLHKQKDDRLAIRITGQRPDAEGNIHEVPTNTKDVTNIRSWQEKVTDMMNNKNNIAEKEQVNQQDNVLNDNIEPPKDFKAYDAAWLKRFQKLSFYKGLNNALAGATFFSLFGIFAGMILDKAGDPNKKISFRKNVSPYVMGAMAIIGAGFSFLANKQAAELRKQEDDRLAHRIRASDDIIKTENGSANTEEALPEKSWKQQVRFTKNYALAR